MTARQPSGRIRDFYDRHAAGYDGQMASAERLLLGEQRRWAAGQAVGQVLEIGVGTGLNLPYYASQVEVTGIDLSPLMLEVAGRKVRDGGVVASVQLAVGDAQALEQAAESEDCVVCIYTLCTVTDPPAAIGEVFRVLRPGGRLILVEHGPSTSLVVRMLQRLLDPISVRLQSDHLLRDPLPDVVGAGFDIVTVDRGGRAGLVHRLVARKPAVAELP